jgi:hypothetical protein
MRALDRLKSAYRENRPTVEIDRTNKVVTIELGTFLNFYTALYYYLTYLPRGYKVRFPWGEFSDSLPF